MTTTDPTPAATVDEAAISAYRRDGVVRVRNVLTTAEAARFRDAASEASGIATDYAGGSAIFNQYVNVWRDHDVLRELTLHPNLARVATALAGVPLRVWHDQLLIKPANNGAATEFHQDAPYWPHSSSRHSLSAWVALVDVPVEKGCMTFIPGSHRHQGLRAQDLADRDDLFRVAPDLRWEERLTIPLQAGDCTFHNAHLAHSATPNVTDDPRIAHVTIYIDAATTYTGGGHVVTDGLGLEPGATLNHPHFPAVGHDIR
ncbi:phytanoyl-CoA dioxygenase family protein [Kribbella sandramycini]|uniref:Ectoine hydroxylase-related dioxygenase (Phytanoyl-CoA dioxygenase family) n=1 Tax=Kribbella sandramycini TaxID=60450 RepID=A0A7Y4NXK4_9ACTN|nr:phytanoyl-CoA dioxygenase family protein [Kribbella sandramycini]MBB6567395.1 ectoine hydroxylase-related dioxygenase (phytanoyl-CoA dioxygenase family) [Kribbella sandramycini]NOL39992.1 phytanoyl-CoA dioxygenase family protein [Kribbella sandramycini]